MVNTRGLGNANELENAFPTHCLKTQKTTHKCHKFQLVHVCACNVCLYFTDVTATKLSVAKKSAEQPHCALKSKQKALRHFSPITLLPFRNQVQRNPTRCAHAFYQRLIESAMFKSFTHSQCENRIMLTSHQHITHVHLNFSSTWCCCCPRRTSNM